MAVCVLHLSSALRSCRHSLNQTGHREHSVPVLPQEAFEKLSLYEIRIRAAPRVARRRHRLSRRNVSRDAPARVVISSGGTGSADELADETFNRIARTLERDGAIATTPPARYCYVVAKFVLPGHPAGTPARPPSTKNAPAPRVQETRGEPDAERVAEEQRLESLECCLETLKPEQRELIVEYYRDGGRQKIDRRRDLARRLGISMNALGIRASRIRSALEACVNARRGQQ